MMDLRYGGLQSSMVPMLSSYGFEHRINEVPLYTQGEVTSRSLWSRYDRHFVGITRYNALS